MNENQLIRYDIPVWGNHMKKTTYRFVPCQEVPIFRHSIGGRGWKYAREEYENSGYPMLLMTIDFQDPHFMSFHSSCLNELPIVMTNEYLSAEITLSYHVNEAEKTVHFKSINEKNGLGNFIVKDIESLGIVPCNIVPLPIDQYCINEQNYWISCDSFLGNSDRDVNQSIIRVLGEPVWLQYVVEEFCECGRKMDFIVSIGYDVSNNSIYSPGNMFMFLEGGMYFFLSSLLQCTHEYTIILGCCLYIRNYDMSKRRTVNASCQRTC